MTAIKAAKKTIYKGTKTCAYALMRRCPPLRKALRKAVWGHREAKYKKLAASIDTCDQTVIFACFMGKAYSCSPRAIFETIQKDARFDNFQIYWTFMPNVIEKYRYLENTYKNLTLIERGSKEYYIACAKAKYWINNSRAPEYIFPKADQIYLQCWHGTPLKRLGCDMVSETTSALNSIQELIERYKLEGTKWDYLLSPSHFVSECLTSAFNLKPQWVEKNILELGYPRNDAIVNTCADTKALASLKNRMTEQLGIKDGKKILLYAPTFRDSEYKSGLGYTQDIMIDFDLLQKELSNEFVILFRAHYFVANKFDFAKYGDFVVNASDVADINELYCISDVLMTDYSSVFFDYACTGRPIIFFQPDLKEYQEQVRGFYLDPKKDLPGPKCYTTQEVLDALANINSYNKTYGQQYKAFFERFCPMEDGKASKRVIEKLFREG